MRLPGTDVWSENDIESAIKFELKFAASAPSILELIDAADRRSDRRRSPNPPISESIFAWGRAAELAFATDKFERGLQICIQMISEESEQPKTPLQWAFFAVVGTLTNMLRVRFHFNGITIHKLQSKSSDEPAFIPWRLDDSPYMVQIIREFLPAVFLSFALQPSQDIFPIASLGELKPQVQSALVQTDEFKAIVAVYDRGAGAERLRSFDAINAMEERYASRVALMRSDVYHWSLLQTKGSLVDWALLAVWVGFYHQYRSAPKDWPIASETVQFVRELAQKIAYQLSRK